MLLDEINLATSETLDCLHGLLENRSGSLVLLERGDIKPINRDEGFRLFAAMNPATDVGKSQLPVGLRNRYGIILSRPRSKKQVYLLDLLNFSWMNWTQKRIFFRLFSLI